MKISDLITTVFVYFLFAIAGLFVKEQKGFRVEFFNVGQGDSALITTVNGKKILIDGGANFEADYKLAKIIPFWSCYLDAVILTHPHYDHIIGLNRILRRCKIGTVMFNDVDFTSQDFTDFKSLVKNLNIKNVFIGDEFVIDGVTFKVLWPDKDFLQTKIADVNDVSVVLFMDYGNFQAMFTGDAGAEVLGRINLDSIKSYLDGDFEVVKVPHHGSKFGLDKEFYEALKPKDCVISVGADNKFGHPSKEVVDFLQSINCNVMRTDKLGDIEMKAL
jgi:competence protein ComEC